MIDKKLFSLIADKVGAIKLISILNILNLILNLGFSAFICYILYIVGMEVESLWASIATSLAGLGAIIIFRFVIGKKINKVKISLGDDIKVTLRGKLLEKGLRLGPSRKNYLSDAAMGQVSIEGVESLDSYFTGFIPTLIYGLAAPIILFCVAVFIDWGTALVLIVALIFIPIAIMLFSRIAKRTFKKYWGRYTSMGDVFLDSLEGMKELKIFNADKRQQKDIAESSESFRKITMSVLRVQLINILLMDIIAFGGAAAGVIMVLVALNGGSITPYFALFLILICVEFFLPTKALGSTFHSAMGGSTAGKNILAALEIQEAKWGDEKLEHIDSVEIRDLTFMYSDGNRDILKNFDMNLGQGMNALVGESGSGKSTIAALLIARHKTDCIFINGKDLFSYDMRSYYDRVTYVGADSFLFNVSVRDNFKLVNESISDEEIYEKLSMVNMDEYIKKIGGLDYIIMENSENISGGQRQRIILACNLTVNRDLYIFDEATSNIDIESEAIIVDVIQKIAESNIVLMISHRLNNVVGARKINYLADRHVSEEGTHGELMTLGGMYAESYSYQSSIETGYLEA